jgi:acyl carrier protein
MRWLAGTLRGYREVIRGNELRTQVEKWLMDWFVTRTKIGKDASENQRDILRNTDYFEAGWLTSMEVVEFVTEIEQQFAMQFSDRDLQDPRFVTIAGLTDLILERSTQASESR